MHSFFWDTVYEWWRRNMKTLTINEDVAYSSSCRRQRRRWWWRRSAGSNRCILYTWRLCQYSGPPHSSCSSADTLHPFTTPRQINTTTVSEHWFQLINPLELRGITVPQRIIWSWYTGRWWVGFYVWYSEEGTGPNRSPPRPFLAVPNVTAHQSTANVPVIVLLYDGPLLCGFNVAIKRLIWMRLINCFTLPTYSFLFGIFTYSLFVQ